MQDLILYQVISGVVFNKLTFDNLLFDFDDNNLHLYNIENNVFIIDDFVRDFNKIDKNRKRGSCDMHIYDAMENHFFKDIVNLLDLLL